MDSTFITFVWNGEAMVPQERFAKRADQDFVVGEQYRMQVFEMRSWATHNHQFAWIGEAWLNLPENLKGAYPTPEHLRKRALIEAGYYDEEIIDVGTKSGALRVASYARSHDDFALVITRGPLVVIHKAKSQSRRVMDAKTFQESKSKIMEIIAGMIGSSPMEIEANAGRSA